jgi:hypothetical protein
MSTTMARAVRQLASTGRMAPLAIPVLADAADQIDKLTAQRDDLLLALKALVEACEWYAEDTYGREAPNQLGAFDEAMALIATCEGREVTHG